MKTSATGSQTLKTSWQGAVVKELEGEEYSAFGTAKEDGGIVLLELADGSPAALTGLKAGDVVQAVGDKKVHNVADLVAATKAAEDKVVTVTYVRNQTRRQTAFKLFAADKANPSNP
ncbi:MAG: PDZ domain-containing protein [Verrucomicrobia bacterium]|nr:PDZ domain-containing protein [Verrucomicrobiota bacterium]